MDFPLLSIAWAVRQDDEDALPARLPALVGPT